MTAHSIAPAESARIVAETSQFVRQQLERDASGHDWHHVRRVWRMALRIADEENARAAGDGVKSDRLVVELAALLHDLDDWKFAGGDELAGPRAAMKWLTPFGLPAELIQHVCDIIRDLSFKGANVATPMRSLEGQIVQDADRLDAIGAIGIGRAFAYGGHTGRAMYDPDIPPQPHDSFESYKKNSGPTLNHFYEKLLLLKERMNTPTAREIASQRHDFMEAFLRQFLTEWDP